MKKGLLLILSAFILSGCETYSLIWVENTTKAKIYFAISDTDYLQHAEPIGNNANPKEKILQPLLPHETIDIRRLGKNGWRNYVSYHDGILRVFIITEEDFNNNSLDTIIKKKLFKTVKYSLEDLELVGWHIHINSVPHK